MKKILFQGDSITDVLRDRSTDRYLGSGYPTVVAANVAAAHPGEYTFMNRGVSGDRIVDVYARMKRDIINLKPDIVSILIGINGVWHEISEHNGVSAEKFERIYDMLMDELTKALPETKFMLLEPFVQYGCVTCPCEEHPDRWEIYQRQTPLRAQATRRIAEKYNAVFVPLQQVFDEASQKAPSEYWLVDGVHPTTCGHGLIAREWIRHADL